MKNQLPIFILSFLATNFSAVASKEFSQDQLRSELSELDSILFEQSFNQCKIEILPSIIVEDFEFYHDVSGIQDKKEFLQAVKNNICSRKNEKITRKLVPGSMEVYPLKNNNQLYGAIQKGVHEFYIQTLDNTKQKTGVAKFTHLWLLKNNEWKLARVLSYDHAAAN